MPVPEGFVAQNEGHGGFLKSSGAPQACPGGSRSFQSHDPLALSVFGGNDPSNTQVLEGSEAPSSIHSSLLKPPRGLRARSVLVRRTCDAPNRWGSGGQDPLALSVFGGRDPSKTRALEGSEAPSSIHSLLLSPPRGLRVRSTALRRTCGGRATDLIVGGLGPPKATYYVLRIT